MNACNDTSSVVAAGLSASVLGNIGMILSGASDAFIDLKRKPWKFVEGPAYVLVTWTIVDKWDTRVCYHIDIAAYLKYRCHSDVHGHPRPGTI